MLAQDREPPGWHSIRCFRREGHWGVLGDRVSQCVGQGDATLSTPYFEAGGLHVETGERMRNIERYPCSHKIQSLEPCQELVREISGKILPRHRGGLAPSPELCRRPRVKDV